MALSYYGEYTSSTTGTTGCVKEFVTKPQDHTRFPPQVLYSCDLCNISHGFRLRVTHMVGTPTQKKRFDEHCLANNLERDVEVPAR